ncbi:hypothetical protein E4U43_003846, partial [Claviceps pusilla]
MQRSLAVVVKYDYDLWIQLILNMSTLTVNTGYCCKELWNHVRIPAAAATQKPMRHCEEALDEVDVGS